MISRAPIWIALVTLVAIAAPGPKPASAETYSVDVEHMMAEYHQWGRDMLLAAASRKEPVSGWQVHPLISAMLDTHKITSDPAWLERAAELAELALDARSDRLGLIAYDGSLKPQWLRSERTSIFYISPFKDYPLETKEAVMAERGWHSLVFSDANHDGLFLSTLLEAATRIRESHPALVERIVADARETVASHEGEWTQLDASTGYYSFKRGSPFFVDGAEIPINEAAPFGEALTLLYELTGRREYLDRAIAMMNRWLDHVTYPDDRPLYPYVVGVWHEGWGEEDTVSVNTPVASPNLNPETFHKAALELAFAIRLTKHASDDRLTRFISGLSKTFNIAAERNWKQLAFFPHDIDLSQPLYSAYVYNPTVMRGWPQVASDRALRLMLLHSALDAPKGQFYLAGVAETLVQMQIGTTFDVQTARFEVSPYLMEQQPDRCLFDVDEDSIAEIALTRPSNPLNSRLLLRPTKDFPFERDRAGITLRVDAGRYTGRAYLKKGDCPQWQWAEVWGLPENSQPAPKENQLSVKLHSLVPTPLE